MTFARRRRPLPLLRSVLAALAALVAGLALLAVPSEASAVPTRAIPAATPAPGQPDLGPNVYVFYPSTPQSQIQSTVDAIDAQQASNQFGDQRYALLFAPGTYGTTDNPLNFQVGYYTEVAGLGASPDQVTINGSIDVRNQCDGNYCTALNNFWRSLSNLTINVTNPDFGCYSGEFWAVSQAAPMRRVHINGLTTLMDYCTAPSYASGGFIADSRLDGTVVNGSQQQFYVRNTELTNWTNGVWNQVFSGDPGAPAQCFPADASCGGPYTTLPTTPVSRERPFLYIDDQGRWQVFVPASRTGSSGDSWSSGSTAGQSIPLSRFYLAQPSDSARMINTQLARGRDLLLTPGVYGLDRSLSVKRHDTLVLGLGFPTLTPEHGTAAVQVADVPGVDVAGLIVDAGPVTSPVLMQVGSGDGRSHGQAGEHGGHHGSNPADPTALQDVFFRIGGPHLGKAKVALQVNSDNVVLDDIWAWRADHGTGVGWSQNTADTGLVVNGDHVTATGLFVEHFQNYEVVWNGADGTDVFFQNEMPYDVPSQDAWNSAPGTLGYAAFKVTPGASGFTGYGMGSYSFFNQGVDIYASHAFETPTTGVDLHDLLTVFLDPTHGSGGILQVVNDTGGSSTKANPSTPVTVVNYP